MLLLVHVDGKNQKVELPDPGRGLALEAFKAAVCSKLVPPRADAFDWEYLDSDFDEWTLLNSDAGLQGLPPKVKLRLVEKEAGAPVSSPAPPNLVAPLPTMPASPTPSAASSVEEAVPTSAMKQYLLDRMQDGKEARGHEVDLAFLRGRS